MEAVLGEADVNAATGNRFLQVMAVLLAHGWVDLDLAFWHVH